ncbi:GNAT family N-acetyltransferase [Streptomyces sp. NPDC093105]|uniref:GNAT family N-acetyltransferase n=1 Tax=Streptomyces sp. NPDC093105 TaxID=3366029 RepID=UPI003824809B
MTELRTERLLLRRWRESDLEPWAAMNADPDVREHLGDPLTRPQSDAVMARMRADFAERDFGWWALEVRATGAFIGRVGLDVVGDDMPFAGVDIGWRLTRSAWGHGYATEAARACLTFGFDVLGLPEVLASTTVGNVRSQSVMRRIGMTRNPADDFEDPSVPEGPLRRCVLYRTSAGPRPVSPRPAGGRPAG